MSDPCFSGNISFNQFQYSDIPTVVCYLFIKGFLYFLFQFPQCFAFPFTSWQFISRLQFPTVNIVHLIVSTTVSIHKLTITSLLLTSTQYASFAVSSLIILTHIIFLHLIKGSVKSYPIFCY